MRIDLVTGDGVPIYQQIVHQITFQVAAGVLAPGAEIPPIRTLADQLVVNPNTVARAYRELERAGVLTTRRTAGTYVADGATGSARASALGWLRGRVRTLVGDARAMAVEVEQLVELIREVAGEGGP